MNLPAEFTTAMDMHMTTRGAELVAWHAAGRYVLAAVRTEGGGTYLLDAAGNTFRAPKAHDSMALAKLIAGWIADDELRPQLVGVIGALSLDELAVLPAPAAVEVGQLVWTQGMGRLRRGIVTSVGRSRVEVAYTTASSAGRIYRNRLPIAELRVDSERARIPAAAPRAVEVEAPHMCEPCARQGAEVEAVTLVEVAGEVDTFEAVCETHREVEAQSQLAVEPALATIRSWPAYDAAGVVFHAIDRLDVALEKLAPLADADARLRAAVADLLAAMHSVHATLDVDASIFVREAAKLGLSR